MESNEALKSPKQQSVIISKQSAGLNQRFAPIIEYDGRKHIKELDAIRGWAILLVLVYHFYTEYFSPFGIGWAGVDLFFVLSGFLITGILIDTRESKRYFVNFYVKRVLRIFPIYFLVLTLLLYIIPTISRTFIPDLGYYLNNQVWFWTYMQNWLFTIKGYPQDRVLRYTWSLCIEEQFYLFWPLIVYKLNTKRIIQLLIAFILLSNILRLINTDFINPNYKYVNVFARLDALSVGAIIAVGIRFHKSVLEKFAFPVLIVSAVSCVLIILFQKSLYFINLYASFTFIALFFGAILIFSISKNIPGYLKFLVRNKCMFFFGKYSYGIYLYHVPIHFWLTSRVLDLLNKQFQLNHLEEFFVHTLFLLLTLGIAVFSFHFIEKPFLKLKNYL